MSICLRYRARAGLTLVELVVAMVVMASIGGIGISSLIAVMKHQKVLDESRTAADSAQWIDIVVRGCVDNLLPVPIGENQPFSRRMESDGSQTYEFLNGIPENYVFLQKPKYEKEAVALLVSLNAAPEGEDGSYIKLTCATQLINLSGRLGDPDVQCLARGLTQFTITPEDGGSNGDDENTLPKSFMVQFAFGSSGANMVSLNQKYPVRIRPLKDEGEEQSE